MGKPNVISRGCYSFILTTMNVDIPEDTAKAPPDETGATIAVSNKDYARVR